MVRLYSRHPHTLMKARKRLTILPGAGAHASGEKTVNLVHFLAKGMGEETVGKPSTL